MSSHWLPSPGPYAASAALASLAAHAVPGLERHDLASGRHTRVVRTGAASAMVTVALHGAGVALEVDAPGPQEEAQAVALVRRWLDVDAPVEQVEARLRADPRLAVLVARRPGLRVVGTVDGFETAALTVLGQQVSLAAARTFGGRLVAAFGTPSGHDGLHLFPEADLLAGLDEATLRTATGVTGARARTLAGLARACADGLRITVDADPVALRAALLALPGIGPWTVDYVALRVGFDRDACPVGDLVLRRALGVRTPREVAALAAPWSPWRSYAVMHLWTDAAYV